MRSVCEGFNIYSIIKTRLSQGEAFSIGHHFVLGCSTGAGCMGVALIAYIFLGYDEKHWGPCGQ